MKNNKYTSIIGLEIHVELKTKSKMFCGCVNDPFHAPKPNMYTCPVCLGLPGALPVPNKRAVEWCIMLGLALNCEINSESKFDRKHYFYPDLPKGFQISQYDQPFCVNGFMEIIDPATKRIKKIGITRVHMEEDTGKLQHASIKGEKVTLIDFNRSGVPLIEIVTEPEIRSGNEAKIFLKKLQQIIRYLDISDAEMSQGSMRLEPNISIKKSKIKNPFGLAQGGQESKIMELPDYKVEVKNINSFKFVEKSINFEIKRHIDILEKGQTPIQETRGFVESSGNTVSQRTKEEAHDYRYFPEPDIPPMRIKKADISRIKAQIPELPDHKSRRFTDKYGITKTQAEILTQSIDKAAFFETCVKLKPSFAQEYANWMINKKVNIEIMSPKELIKEVVDSKKIHKLDSETLNQTVKDIIKSNPKPVSDYKKGKKQVLMFLLGQVRKALGGKGEPREILSKLKEYI